MTDLTRAHQRPELSSTTLKDVARRAGVHPSTVSRVINHNGGVAPETRERVAQAIAETKYRPNLIARSLKLQSTNMLGMLVPHIDLPVLSQIVKSVQRAATAMGYHMLLADTNDVAEQEEELVHRLVDGQLVDGIILASVHLDSRVIAWLEAKGFPYVLVNRRAEGAQRYVVFDDEGATMTMVSHLLGLGHRRVAHLVGPLYTETGVRRLKGYRRALQDHGVPFYPELLVECGFSQETGYAGMLHLLDRGAGPTAVYADLQASVGAVKAIKERGLKVPGDISVAAYHDVPLATIIDPPLTTMRMPLTELGDRAVELLAALIRGDHTKNEQILLTGDLVVRESTAPPLSR